MPKEKSLRILAKFGFQRWPLIPFRQLMAYSLLLVFPTVVALDILVFYGDLHIDFALWVIAGTMVSAVAVAWIFLGDMADMALYTRGVERGDLEALPELRSSAVREVAQAVMQLDGKWRRHVQAFSRSLDTDKDILETLYDPLLLIDAHQHVVGINAAARQLFGVPAIKKPLPELGYPDQIVQSVRIVLETKQPAAFELSFASPERYFEVRIIPITAQMADEGWDKLVSRPENIAVVATLHEITETRRVAAMQERFVANVSHELRTPLASIMGFTETLLGPAKDDEAARARFLKITHDQAMRMSRLVGDLQELSRVEETKQHFERQAVDLSRLLPAVCEALSLKAATREIRFELSAFEKPLIVEGDEDQLFRVFQNLVENAIKYGRQGSAIRFPVHHAAGEISIAVQDEGDGIAPEHLPHLGERFYRADQARSRTTGGNGLGLAIVSQILLRHHGRLAIASEPGRGSTFTVTLPLSLQEFP